MNLAKTIVLIVIGLVLLTGGLALGYYIGFDLGYEKAVKTIEQLVNNQNDGNDGNQLTVSNFDDCVAAGYPVQESYPSVCRTPDGQSFTQDIGNELEKQNLIKLDDPRPNQTIASPLTITGEARGNWFFEASFPIRLLDANGQVLATAIAQAVGEWMTENFVPFSASLTFTTPTTPAGTLILQKDNPSGLPENDDQLLVPVKFNLP